MTTIKAPFTDTQVAALNAWQSSGMTHPFTCRHHSFEPLIATRDGWVCGIEGCGYTQDWAHDFMADVGFLERYRIMMKGAGIEVAEIARKPQK